MRRSAQLCCLLFRPSCCAHASPPLCSPAAAPHLCAAVGVFLLNKDVIQLLQAHGISAAGPNQLLHNLYKLLLAAQSALPHLPPSGGAAQLAAGGGRR